MAIDPYDRVTWPGKPGIVFNRRTRDMLEWVQETAGVRLYPGQGSYKGAGGGSRVSASGSTHDGGGAVDLSIRWYNKGDKRRIVRAMKDAGFAFWHRLPTEGPWPEHGHGIAIGDKEASRSALDQVASYLKGRNGLRNNAVDDSYRPDPQVEWDYRTKRPAPVNKRPAWDGVVPDIVNVYAAEESGAATMAAYRVAARLYDLGHYKGNPPVLGRQGYPVRAVAAWQQSRGYRPTGRWGPKAHSMLFAK